MEALDALNTANSEFESRLRQIQPEQWALPTPCEEWDVRGLVNHMLLGTRMSIQVLDGMDRDEVIAGLNDDMLAGDVDPIATFVDLASQMVAGFSGPDGLEGMVAHPAGDFPRSMFIGFRVTDSAAHAWDLAKAIGADDTLNADMVQFLWDDTEPKRDMLTATGMFGEGASGSVSDDAPLQARYLDLIGRRP
ncbi:MAG: TIGR03086 family metal-binding protein [Acidimicrobiales bacterium]